MIRPLKILLVDDSSINRKLLRKMIEDEFEKRNLPTATFTSLPDGEDVIQLFRNSSEEAMSIDCILMVIGTASFAFLHCSPHCISYRALS